MDNKKEQPADQKDTKKTIELFLVEKLKKELNVSDSIFAGVMAHKKWLKGKQVTKKEMEIAINEFLKTPLK